MYLIIRKKYQHRVEIWQKHRKHLIIELGICTESSVQYGMKSEAKYNSKLWGIAHELV